MVLVNTQLATATAIIAWMFAEWTVKGKPSMLGAASGAVAGLVAIAPACGIGLRVTEEQERDGLDVSEHGETAYN
jgi:ammonia channel protein AmtB